jgi:prevent-host-death family protein
LTVDGALVKTVTMRTTSLAEAKAHLSELVDQVEHHGRKIVILRHGKPAAALVPVAVILPRPRCTKRLPGVRVRTSVAVAVAALRVSAPHHEAATC